MMYDENDLRCDICDINQSNFTFVDRDDDRVWDICLECAKCAKQHRRSNGSEDGAKTMKKGSNSTWIFAIHVKR